MGRDARVRVSIGFGLVGRGLVNCVEGCEEIHDVVLNVVMVLISGIIIIP